jgi:hypothetical protein
VNLCRGCNEDFASASAFDRHRTGTHRYLWSAEREDGRRCLDDAEMLDAGMEPDKRGGWRIIGDAERIAGWLAEAA